MKIIYGRQSVDKKDSISIETQVQECMRELSEEDRAEFNLERDVFIDKGYSGKNTERPAFQKLMGEIIAGRVEKVIVYKLDRISRNLLDFMQMYSVFEEYKVAFVSVHEKFDTTNPMGKAMLAIAMVFAQMERETIQQRVTDNYFDRMSKGYYPGGAAPFGFLKTETKIDGKRSAAYEPDPKTAPVLLSLFEQYATTNISLGELGHNLLKQGIPTSTGSHWTGSSLGRVLRNPAYVKADAEVYHYLRDKHATMNNDVSDYIGQNGLYLYQKNDDTSSHKKKIGKTYRDLSKCFVTVAPHQGIVPAYLWLRVQRKLDKNSQIKCSGRGKHTWLSGLMECGYCHTGITAVNNNHGHCYINCYGRKTHICNGRTRGIKIYQIEEVAEEELLTYLVGLKNHVIKKEVHENPKLNKLKIAQVKMRDELDGMAEKLLQMDGSALDFMNQKMNERLQEFNRLQKEINTLIYAQEQQNGSNLNIGQVLEEWDDYDLEQRKAVAKIFIEKVIITDDVIEVHFY